MVDIREKGEINATKTKTKREDGYVLTQETQHKTAQDQDVPA
jgi:hypothetical protein